MAEKYRDYFVTTNPKEQEIVLVLKGETVKWTHDGVKTVIAPAVIVTFRKGRYTPANDEEMALLTALAKSRTYFRLFSAEEQVQAEEIEEAKKEAEANVRAKHMKKKAPKPEVEPE
jgi:hypothetical protein